MEVIDLPELDELLRADDTRSFPYTKTFAEAAQDPFCVLHTSGSTGLPKPISWTHALIGTMDAVRLLPPTKGDHGLRPWSDNWDDGDKIYSSFPMTHGAGIIMNILLPALFRMHCIMGPPGVIPNMNLIDSLAEHGDVDIWSMIPSLVDELAENPDILAKFASSKFICASGGPVSPLMGGKVNQVVRVLNLTGTTEGLFIGNLWTEREDWFNFAFHPYSGFEFKEVEKGLYEHWVHRLHVEGQADRDLFQGIFHTFPSEKSINLKDLYKQHPTKPYLWSYTGRNDDILVLSNGYKISPLDTEAFITTHPAIEGCLMIGSGKPQAGLLIELKDATSTGKSDELLNSIWATVKKANSISLHKNQISKDYIAFVQADKPFIRTDKRTVKRRATLELYNDYVDRFYKSRVEEEDAAYQDSLPTVDTSSLEGMSGSIQEILLSILPTPPANGFILPEDDFFALGVDSILAFRAVKSIRTATGLHDKLTPRHIYGNSTLPKFTAIVWKLVQDQERASNPPTNGHVREDQDPQVTKMKKLLAQHRARLSNKVNPFDMMNPNIYVGMKFYLSLSDPNDSDPDTFGQVYTLLREGLKRTMQMIPELQGRVMRCSEHEMGFTRGDLHITLPPVPSTATASAQKGPKLEDVPQLKYKDLSAILPSFSELKAGGFAVSAFDDAVVLDCEWFPTLPADVLVAQANFIKGGCILAINVHHAGFDGVGVINAMRCWAENCRYIQGDRAATCSWVDPDSLNRDLLHVLYELEGYAKPAEEVDTNVWGYLGFPDPALLEDEHVGERNGNGIVNGNHYRTPTKKTPNPNTATLTSNLPIPPPFPRKFAWPPITRPDGRSMRSTTFLLSASNIEKLRLKVLSETPKTTPTPSISDIIQSLFWRSAIRARYRVSTELRSTSIPPSQLSIVEMPIDARTYFSNLLPSSYMGSCLITNRPSLPVQELVSPSTKLSTIAKIFKEAGKHISPQLIHDAFTLLQSVPDYTMITNACMGLAGFHCMMNNMMLFRTDEIKFGFDGAGKRGLLGRNGVPEAMRVQMDRFNTAFRLLVILPMRADGGVELLLGTLPEEFAMLMRDGEFGEFTSFLG